MVPGKQAKISTSQVAILLAGFDFPRGPGAYAPRFCSGPLGFQIRGPK